MRNLSNLKKELRKTANKERAKVSQGFFKTGKREYGEGDIFIGVTVPEIRKVAKNYSNLTLKEIEMLLNSKIHEERLCAVLILVHRYKIAPGERKEIYNFYLKNTKRINNWDLVDLSAHKIVGNFLLDKNRKILYKLIKSKNLWERRIAVISTFAFIDKNDFKDNLKLSEILLKNNEKHDLMHKAAGWTLREIGKKDLKVEEDFLKKHYKKMPRTMLRYAIEKFPEKTRKAYLNGKI